MSNIRKAIVGALLPVIYAVANQLLLDGTGPTEAEITNLSVTAGDAVKLLVEMGIGGFLVWLVPNKPNAPVA